jgi:eukaryotic-like serine/threonine-protein kinase
MGVIYKAHDPDIDRPVAIKLVRADLLAGADRADYIARFRREVRAAGRCVHPNIVAIHDFALHEGNPFLAMEFVAGATLAQRLEDGARFTPVQAASVITQVLDALACAHGLGIVHRDIKPANIMLLADGRVKVTDFGISRVEGSDLTHAGTVVGTPSYMSPEQCLGQTVDERSDLFSTGAVLYQLLAAARPFTGRTVAETTQKVLNSEPPDLAVAPELQLVVGRALAKRAEDRFGSAAAMKQALLAAIASQPPGGDGTVVVPSTPPAPRFDPQLLGGIERALASHVGPIARHLVQTGARKAASAEELCAALTRTIDDAAERTRFLRAVGALARGGSAPASSILESAISTEEADRATRALARHLGPIAKLLVRRALAGARSPDALWAELARQIDSDADRAIFLRERAG